MGIRTSNAINGLIYEKSLKFSLIRSVEHSQGSLVNHLQVDSATLFYLGMGVGGTIVLPFTLGIGIYFMWAAVGISFLSGIGILILVGIANFVLGNRYFG